MNDPSYCLAFDIGGTKLAAGLADRHGKIICRQESLTLASEGREAILNRIERLGHAVLAEAGGVEIAAVGVATAGQANSATGVVVYATPNLPGWSGLNLGACIDGIHGRACNCGGKGCLETYASTRALLGDFITAHRKIARPEFTEKKVGQWTAQDIARAYATQTEQEWPELHRVVNQAADWLGLGLAALFNVLDPELIVVGGSIQLFGEPYLHQVHSALVERATRLIRPLPVIFSSVGADGGLLGVAVLAWSRVDGA